MMKTWAGMVTQARNRLFPTNGLLQFVSLSILVSSGPMTIPSWEYMYCYRLRAKRKFQRRLLPPPPPETRTLNQDARAPLSPVRFVFPSGCMIPTDRFQFHRLTQKAPRQPVSDVLQPPWKERDDPPTDSSFFHRDGHVVHGGISLVEGRRHGA